MSVAWLAPIAFAGTALVLLPIAIHLFVRQHARRLPFPSLRFLRDTQLAAFRVRRIEDPWLLLVRAAIIVVAALALAGPVLQSAGRNAATAARVSRAMIHVDAAGQDPPQSVFRSASFYRADVVDAIADATRWLNAQPASSREIVFVGALRRGDVGESQLSRIPAGIGVRFERQSSSAPSTITVPILAMRDGSLVRIDRLAHLTSDATSVTDGPPIAVRQDLIQMSAKAQSLANAALRAALGDGVPWRDFETPVRVELADDTSIADAADAIMRQLRRLSPPRLIEPVVIPDAQLAKWTRQPGPPSPTAPVADEGDRHWVWLLALMLLGVEWRLRRRASGTAAMVEAARVA